MSPMSPMSPCPPCSLVQCREFNISIPKFVVVDASAAKLSDSELADLLAANDLKFPLMVKPSLGAGKYFLCGAANLQELARGVQAFYANLPSFMGKWGIETADEARIVIEEFVTGSEVCFGLGTFL